MFAMNRLPQQHHACNVHSCTSSLPTRSLSSLTCRGILPCQPARFVLQNQAIGQACTEKHIRAHCTGVAFSPLHAQFDPPHTPSQTHRQGACQMSHQPQLPGTHPTSSWPSQQRRHRRAWPTRPSAGALDVMPAWTLDQIAGLLFGVSAKHTKAHVNMRVTYLTTTNSRAPNLGVSAARMNFT